MATREKAAFYDVFVIVAECLANGRREDLVNGLVQGDRSVEEGTAA